MQFVCTLLIDYIIIVFLYLFMNMNTHVAMYVCKLCTCNYCSYTMWLHSHWTTPIAHYAATDESSAVTETDQWECSAFFNQARAGRRPARAWFPNIDPVRTSVCVCVFVCVCVRPRGY